MFVILLQSKNDISLRNVIFQNQSKNVIFRKNVIFKNQTKYDILPKNVIFSLIIILLLTCQALFAQTSINQPNHPLHYGAEFNTYNGNLFYERTDFYIPSAGMALDMSFHYNSIRDTLNTGYGFGWTFKSNIYYEQNAEGNITIHRGDARKENYTLDNGMYTPETGTFNSVQFSNDTLKVTTKYGQVCEFGNLSHKKITKESDLNGNYCLFEYNPNGHLTKITDSYGKTIELTWNNDLLQSLTDLSIPEKERSWQYEYTNNYLTQVINPEGFICRYEYSNGLLSKLIDENGNAADIAYRPNKSLQSFITTETEHQFEYDISNLFAPKTVVKELVEAEYQTTTYTYDDQKRITAKEGNCCGFRFEYEYDPATNQISLIRDANGQEQTFVYNAKGDVLQEIDELGNAIIYTYTNQHQIEVMLDRKGNKTRYEYNAKGDVTATHYPLGISIYQTFNNDGTVATSTNGRGFTTQFFYDQYGYLDYSVNAVGDTMHYRYDARGNKLEHSDYKGNYHRFAYNQLDWLVADTSAAPFIMSHL